MPREERVPDPNWAVNYGDARNRRVVTTRDGQFVGRLVYLPRTRPNAPKRRRSGGGAKAKIVLVNSGDWVSIDPAELIPLRHAR